jgi:peptidase E
VLVDVVRLWRKEKNIKNLIEKPDFFMVIGGRTFDLIFEEIHQKSYKIAKK